MSKNAMPPAAGQEIASAIKQICEEKNIPYESVIDTINQALAAAYRKDFGEKNQNLKAEFNPENGKTRVFDVKTVVEDLPEEELAGEKELGQSKEKRKEKGEKEAKKGLPSSSNLPNHPTTEEGKREGTNKENDDEEEKPRFNPRTDIQITDAKALKKVNPRIHSGAIKLGDEIRTELKIPSDFGRMAAQTAKQVIIQRLREAERDVLYKEFKNKEGQVLTGIVQRREGRLVLIDLGTTTAIIPSDQQIETENYNSGQRYRVYLSEVRETSKGPEIIASRTHPQIVKQLFTVEVPEIASGTVEIKGLAREAGSRSKVAVATDDDSIDPIGSCVGQRGTRIQTIITELGGEKIDIIQYNDEPAKFVSNALSPAKVIDVKLHKEEKIARVKVRPDQLSLAIGKAGQNVRLAAKLTGWKIDIEEAAVPGVKSGEGEKPGEDKNLSSKALKEAKKEESEEGKSEDKKDSEEIKADEDKKSDEKAELEETKKLNDEESEKKEGDGKEESDDVESKSVNNPAAGLSTGEVGKAEETEETKDEAEKASEAKPHTKTEASGAGEEKKDNKKEKEKAQKGDDKGKEKE